MDSEFGLGNQHLFEYYEQAERVDMREKYREQTGHL